jgi:hypothetical protein
MFVTKLGHYPLVLGIPWLKLHDVAIHFASNLITFGSQYCLAHCNDRAVTIQGISEDPPDAPTNPIRIAMVGPATLHRQAKRQ